MSTLFLNRKQYDLLVTRAAAWMQLRWSSYSHQWEIGGVTVSGRQHEIENLKAQLLSVI